ncbi:MAG: DUF4389 domain-containing protein [Oceanicoccus sp.]
MNGDIKQNLKESSIWKRALYMLLFAVFYSIAEMVLFAVVVFQFLFKLVTGETNERLLDFGQSLATYVYQIVQFLNFNTENHPYPFGEWPEGGPVDSADEISTPEDDSFSSDVVEESTETPVESIDETDDDSADVENKLDDSAESDSDDGTKLT